MARMRLTRMAIVALALVGAATVVPAQQITATQDRALALLQAKMTANPNNFAAVRAVGVKLFDLKQFANARPVL